MQINDYLEKEICLLVKQGKTNTEIGKVTKMKPHSIANRLTNIFASFDVSNRHELISKLYEQDKKNI